MLLTVERFVTELQKIIKALGLEKYHILGHSWGAGLAVAFACTKPEGLMSLILSNPYLSTSVWEKDAQKLLQQLPEAMQQALTTGLIDSEQYKDALKEFYNRFFWRLDSFPTAILKSEHKMNNEIYSHMWGPEEFHASGNLKNFDVIAKLSEVSVPVLLLCGRYDSSTPASTAYFQSLFPNAQMAIFEKSAHVPFWTEKEKYLKIVEDFLRKVE